MSWKKKLIESYSPSTVNRRMCALRELVRTLRTTGLVEYSIEIRGVKAESQEMPGPGLPALQKMMNLAHRLSQDEQPKKARKGLQLVCLVRMLFDLGLRRAEVSALDVADIEGSKIQVHQKGRALKSRLELPKATQEAINAWLLTRNQFAPRDQTALFVNQGGDRLTPDYIYQLIVWLGRKVGIKCIPHGLRHTAITTAFEKAQQHGFDLKQLKQFSRHKKVDTLLIYRDQTENAQGRVASVVANQLE